MMLVVLVSTLAVLVAAAMAGMAFAVMAKACSSSKNRRNVCFGGGVGKH